MLLKMLKLIHKMKNLEISDLDILINKSSDQTV